ncbi:hypothetical protein PROFUN_01203 [Planoprotostelium fungivorum]|uniref:Uncharacterized protein n=1 Tax=Planoprotostelium fungivorum TaxID=1890364 RepID=A0A2P6NCK4_9EUKA|nr:hypothetical protein PROFUN_01203 [Planoprotostelium fungivorum]
MPHILHLFKKHKKKDHTPGSTSSSSSLPNSPSTPTTPRLKSRSSFSLKKALSSPALIRSNPPTSTSSKPPLSPTASSTSSTVKTSSDDSHPSATTSSATQSSTVIQKATSFREASSLYTDSELVRAQRMWAWFAIFCLAVAVASAMNCVCNLRGLPPEAPAESSSEISELGAASRTIVMQMIFLPNVLCFVSLTFPGNPPRTSDDRGDETYPDHRFAEETSGRAALVPTWSACPMERRKLLPDTGEEVCCVNFTNQPPPDMSHEVLFYSFYGPQETLIFNNGTTSQEKSLWERMPAIDETHIHLIVSNMLFLATAITLCAQFGRLRTRRNFLYVTTSAQILMLLLCQKYYFAWLALWGIFHSCAHHFWPFITVAGLNIKATAFPDVFVHLTMHAIVHFAACQLGISDTTRFASSIVLAGCLWNAYLAYYSRVDEKWFVYTSMFQALSTGSWVGHLLSVSLQHSQAGFVYESNLWLMWGGAAMNWFLFKNSNKMLKKLFTISYLDTLFIFPVWLYMCNNWA